MKAVAAIARAMLRGWRHEVIRSLGGNVWAYRGVLTLLALSGVGWTLLAASARNMLGLAALDGSGLRTLLLATSLNLALAMAAVVTVGVSVLVPETSSFATLLATMPLSQVQRRIALEGPVLACGLLTAALVSAPFLWLSLQAAPGRGSAPAIIAAWLSLSVVGVLAGAACHRAAGLVLGLVLRLSTAIARPVAAISVYVLVAQQCLVSGVGPGHAVSATRSVLQDLARLCFTAPSTAATLSAGLSLAAAAAWWLVAMLDALRPPRPRAHLVARGGGVQRLSARSLFRLEVLQLLRHPVNQSSIIVLAALAAATPFFSAVRDALLWPLGGVLLLSIASLLVVGSYGATWSHHWLFRVASADPVGWVRSKWLSSAAFWLAIVALLTAAFTATPLWNVRILAIALPQLFLAFVVSMLVGLAVPASEEQPLSSVVGVVLAAVSGLGLYLATDKLSGGSEAALLALVLVLAVAGAAGYLRLAEWRERDLVF